MPPNVPNRGAFTTLDTIKHLWSALDLPPGALKSLALPQVDSLGLPSSYKVGHLAQASIALSALAAALIHTVRLDSEVGRDSDPKDDINESSSSSVPRTSVPLDRACTEFRSERYFTLDGKPPATSQHAIGGLHRTANNGHVRIHDSFPHHRAIALNLIGCTPESTVEEVNESLLKWDAVELESRGIEAGAVIGALRSVEEWDLLEQAKALADVPVIMRRVAEAPKGWKPRLAGSGERTKALKGIRVLEFSRVLAAPVAGRTLAAHGADVLWVTSPNLPDLPALDRDTSRGKRGIHLDLNESNDKKFLEELCEDVDVVIQGYRPGTMAQRGLSVEELAKKSKHGVVVANLSAYGSSGPWSHRRGFDSIVQTQSGLNVSETEHYGEGGASKVLPCQVLDHASGYFLAFGVMAALYKQATEGGSYAVEVSLAATMKYLRSLGQYEGKNGFQCEDISSPEGLSPEMLETRDSGYGRLQAIKHSASIDGLYVGWDLMPQKPVNAGSVKWL